MFHAIVSSIIILALIVVIRYQHQELKQTQKDLDASRKGYSALDIGMMELQDSYEQDFLTKEETIQKCSDLLREKRSHICRLFRIVKFHELNCPAQFGLQMDVEDTELLNALYRSQSVNAGGQE